jgi:hypothetical protein
MSCRSHRGKAKVILCQLLLARYPGLLQHNFPAAAHTMQSTMPKTPISEGVNRAELIGTPAAEEPTTRSTLLKPSLQQYPLP